MTSPLLISDAANSPHPLPSERRTRNHLPRVAAGKRMFPVAFPAATSSSGPHSAGNTIDTCLYRTLLAFSHTSASYTALGRNGKLRDLLSLNFSQDGKTLQIWQVVGDIHIFDTWYKNGMPQQGCRIYPPTAAAWPECWC